MASSFGGGREEAVLNAALSHRLAGCEAFKQILCWLYLQQVLRQFIGKQFCQGHATLLVSLAMANVYLAAVQIHIADLYQSQFIHAQSAPVGKG